MNVAYKTGKLCTGVACAALLLSLATPAQAFDEVDWEWNKIIKERVNSDINIDIDLSPNGIVQLEKTQMSIGDIVAKSHVSAIDNKTPEVPADTAQVSTNKFGWPKPPPVVVPDEPLDAVDLPAVESVATAVANNQQIEGFASLELHDAQFAFGGFAEGSDNNHWWKKDKTELGDLLGDDMSNGNIYTDMLLAMVSDGAAGNIVPAWISAESTVSDILNASVDSSATAVANNTSIDLNAYESGEVLAIADMTQMAYADLLAVSTVTDITAKNYGNMAALDKPLVSSVATAVGNNLSFKVGGPEL